MSLYALAWAFGQQLPPNEKIVLLALADCENDETLRCDPSQSFIAKKASVSERQVRDMLTKLEDRGLIARTRRGSTAGGRRSDDFRLACRPEPVDNSGLPADPAGWVTGRNEGGYRQTSAGIENRKEPEVTTGPVPNATTDADALAEGTGPNPSTVSRTFGKPLDVVDILAAIGDWLPLTFDDTQVHILAKEILDHAGVHVLDPTAYVITTIRNTVKDNERRRGRWLLRADEIGLEHIALADRRQF